MEENVNRNVDLLKNLIEAINKIENEERVREFIKNIEYSKTISSGPYAQCLYDLKQLVNVDFGSENYIERMNKICSYYLEYAMNHDPIKKHTIARKEKYKQLNLDMPIELMEEFDKCLDMNHETKKMVITKAIEDYISKNQTN